MHRIPLAGLFFVSLFLHAEEPGSPLRLGLLPVDTRQQAAWELTTAELLTRPDVEILERNRLEELLAEDRLQAAALSTEQSLNLGRRLRADGLLRLQSVREQGKPVWLLSLSAVAPGAIIAMERFDRLPRDPADLSETILAFAERHLPRLRVPPESLKAVTLMPVQLDVMRMDTLDLEARMSRHLAERLTAAPRIALLEREDLGPFIFDQFFTEGAEGSFWQSSALIHIRVMPEPGSDTDVRFRADITHPGGSTQRVEGGAARLQDWEIPLDQLAYAVLNALDADLPPANEEALQAEAARLAALAMRFYTFDPDRALRFADTAWRMGNRGRDVSLIRTQTRLQDLFMLEREPVIHELQGVPPRLMSLHVFPQFQNKYGRGKPIPAPVLAGMLEETARMQRDLLQNIEQWSAEPRGWIALQTALLNAMTLQGEASRHPDWEHLKFSARRNAAMMRPGIEWLRENNQFGNLFLREGAAMLHPYIWEEPEDYFKAILDGILTDRFDYNRLDRLRTLGPGERSRLSPLPEEEWEAMRRQALAGLRHREDLVSGIVVAHMRIRMNDPAFADMSHEELASNLGTLTGKALLHPHPESSYRALEHLLLLAEDLSEEAPGLRSTMAEKAFAITLERLRNSLQDNETPTHRHRPFNEAAAAVSATYVQFQDELFLKMPPARRDEILRKIGLSRMDEANNLLYPMVQNARDWLAMAGTPLPPRTPAPDIVRLLMPVPAGHPHGGFEPPPGHMVDFHAPSSLNRLPLRGNGRTWAWDLRALRLEGFDPQEILPHVTIELPPPQSPSDALYRHALYPIRVEGDWALFHTPAPFPGRGQIYALRISDGHAFEHKIDTGEPRAFTPLFRGFTALPFGGHIRGDAYFYSPVRPSGSHANVSTPSDRIYRLDLITGEELLLSNKDSRGPLPGSRNPPRTTGHLIPWGPDHSAVFQLRHHRRQRTLELQVDVYSDADESWERLTFNLNEWAEAYRDNTIPNVALSNIDPRYVMLCGGVALDLETGGLADPNHVRADRVHINRDTLEAYVTREENGQTVHYLLEHLPFEWNPRALFLGERLFIYEADAIREYRMGPETVSMLDPERADALNGDGAAAFALSTRALHEGDLRQAFFWCRRAAEAGHPGADSLMALFFLSGRLPHTGQRIPGERAPPWIQRAIAQNDPWGWYALHALRVGPPQAPPHPSWDAGPEGALYRAAQGGIVSALHHVAVGSRSNTGLRLAAMREVDRLETQRAAQDEPEPPHAYLLRESTFQMRFPYMPIGHFNSAEHVLSRLPEAQRRTAVQDAAAIRLNQNETSSGTTRP